MPVALALLSLMWNTQVVLGALNTNSSTATMKVYEAGAEKLTAYTDVPGHAASVINGYPSRAKSDIYEIWVRSAATFSAATGSNEWVRCFANMTYNRGLEMPIIPQYETAGSSHAYWKITAGWTHTYANIEMSPNSPVEVEIRKIGSTTLNGSTTIVKSAVHPAHKIANHSNYLGRVYFTITNPCQVAIDINGQMDDHNAAFAVGTPGGAMPGNPPVHTIALYANPIMAKPVASATNTIVTVTPNQSSATSLLAEPNPATYDTLVFAPGVHHIGPGFKVHPGKNYYIPGDAILYGNLSNEGVSQGSYRCTGDRINIYGYGTICGMVIPHYQNRTDDDTANGTPNPEYPEYLSWPDPKDDDVGIKIGQAWDTKITGITVADPANFNSKFDVYAGRVNDQSLVSWVKLHSWRVNGDGCGGYVKIEDSFIRASDDNTYIRDWRRRCTFWKDSNANIFRFINYCSGGIEDSDVLYARFRFTGGAGNVFDFVGYSGSQSPVLTFKNIRFHDKLSNPRCLITLEPTTQAFTNATFENVSFYTQLNNQLSEIIGGSSARYTGRVMFTNVTFQNGLDGSSPVRLTRANYTNYFTTSAFVDPSIFEPAQTAPPTAEAVPWAVNFNGLATGTTSQGAPTTWTATRSGNFRVVSDRLEVSGAGDEGVFTSGLINISNRTVNLALDVLGAGGLDIGGDYARLYIKVNGGAETLVNGVTGPQAAATWATNGITGNTLEVVIRTLVSAATEYYYFDNLSVTDSGPVAPIVTVSATDAGAAEPADSGTFTFTRSGSTAGALTVNFAVSGSAASGTDYQSLGTSVTIPDGQASATKTVTVIDDSAVEGSETVVATLASGSYSIGSPSGATVNIADDDVFTVTVSATDASAGEPADNGMFTFTRSGGTSGDLTVNFAVSGTASGSDYGSLGTSVIIPDGQASATKTVTVIDDSTVESNETVVVTLASGSYSIGSPSSATVNIADNDVLSTVTVSATDASAAEPADNGMFTFTRSGGTSGALTVNFAVSGTASGSDYQSLGTSVTIPDGQASATKTVTVIDDSAVEGSETVVVTLASGSYSIGSPSSATVNIADDDVFSVTVNATDASAGEPADNGMFTFTRSGGTSGALTVNFTVSGTAASGSDYQSLGTSVVIPDGQASATKTVIVTNDAIAESAETVVVTLASGAGYTLGSPSSATVNIADNDSTAEALPWVVNFNGLTTGTTNQGSPTTWTATRGGNFRVVSDRLEVNGAGGEGVFTTGVMDISGGSVNLSLGVLGAGGLDASGTSQDYVRLYIKVNGGAETLVRQVLGAQAAATWTTNGITGSTLQVVIRSLVTSVDEFYYFDNLSITRGLPSPWQTVDVGTVAAIGSASFSNPTWTIAGSGDGIDGISDDFRYVYQSASGDCSVVARVASLTNPSASAKAGVMIRETTAVNAQSALVSVTSSNGIIFQSRSTTGGTTANVTVTGQTAPKWLKVTRTGNLFAASYSDNGTNWTQVGTSQTINMATSATIGLAVTSHLDGTLCTSTMDSVTAAP